MLIPKEVFAVSKCAARESTRYAINGVSVERDTDGTCRATVTDGHVILSVSWDDAKTRAKFPDVGASIKPVDGFSSIVDRKHWDKAAKDITNRISEPILRHSLLDETTTNGRADFRTIQRGKQPLHSTEPKQVEAETIEGRFPKWRDIIPDYTIGVDAVEIGVDPKLLATLLRAFSESTTTEDSRSEGVRLVVPISPNRPMVVDSFSDDRKGTGVCMPVNLNGQYYQGPERAANTPIGQAWCMASIIKRLDLDTLDDETTQVVRGVRAALADTE